MREGQLPSNQSVLHSSRPPADSSADWLRGGQAALSPDEDAASETMILVVRGSLEEVFAMAMQQRHSLEQ